MRDQSNPSCQVPIATISIMYYMKGAVYQLYCELHCLTRVSHSTAPIGTVSYSITYSGTATQCQ